MALVLPDRLVAPVAAANLASFDPEPLSRYISNAGDTLALIARKFYGMTTRELVTILSEANGVLASAVLPAGVPIVVPQPLWRVLIS